MTAPAVFDARALAPMDHREEAIVRVTLMGSTCTEKKLRHAVGETITVRRGFREGFGMWWVLALDVPTPCIEDLGRAVGTRLTVIDVEFPLSGREEDLDAETYLVDDEGNRGRSKDLRKMAMEIIREHQPDLEGGNALDDVEPEDLVWSLAEATSAPRVKPTGTAPPPDLEDRWAMALIDKLLESGGLELQRPEWRPTAELANQLQFAPVRKAIDEEFAEGLIDVLIESPMVEEVYVSEEELAELIRDTRPGETPSTPEEPPKKRRTYRLR